MKIVKKISDCLRDNLVVLITIFTPGVQRNGNFKLIMPIAHATDILEVDFLVQSKLYFCKFCARNAPEKTHTKSHIRGVKTWGKKYVKML